MKKEPLVSVIIPTSKRPLILKKTLKALCSQRCSKDKFEIIVIQDRWQQGPAASRNKGIKKSRGKILLFLNDDTIPHENLIFEHLQSHQKNPQENFAVLGLVTWSPELKITPLMKWLERGGPQFSYYQIQTSRACWHQAWTSNLSYKKSFLLKFGIFDEDFLYPAWEDIELAYRLHQHNLKIFYNKNALAYHYHPTSLYSLKEKMKKHGAGAVVLGRKISEEKVLPPLAKPFMGKFLDFWDKIFFIPPLCCILEKICFFAEKRFNISFMYHLLLLHYRILGRREFLEKNA